MTGIERDGNATRRRRMQAPLRLVAVRRRRGLRRLRRGNVAGVVAFALQQRHQRIDRRERVEIDRQPIPVLGHRREREHLWPHVRLEIENDAQEPLRRTPDANRGNVRVRGLHMRSQLLERTRRFDAREIEHEPIGMAQHDELMLDRCRGFEDDARVLFGGPQPRRCDMRCIGPRRGQHPLRGRQQQPAKRAAARDRYARQSDGGFVAASTLRHRSPAAEKAFATTSRPRS